MSGNSSTALGMERQLYSEDDCKTCRCTMSWTSDTPPTGDAKGNLQVGDLWVKPAPDGCDDCCCELCTWVHDENGDGYWKRVVRQQTGGFVEQSSFTDTPNADGALLEFEEEPFVYTEMQGFPGLLCEKLYFTLKCPALVTMHSIFNVSTRYIQRFEDDGTPIPPSFNGNIVVLACHFVDGVEVHGCDGHQAFQYDTTINGALNTALFLGCGEHCIETKYITSHAGSLVVDDDGEVVNSGIRQMDAWGETRRTSVSWIEFC